jgi:hypothetical protein
MTITIDRLGGPEPPAELRKTKSMGKARSRPDGEDAPKTSIWDPANAWNGRFIAGEVRRLAWPWLAVESLPLALRPSGRS